MDVNSLAHTKWNCKYHIVFIPKYQKKKLFGQLKCDVWEMARGYYVATAGNVTEPLGAFPPI